MPEVGGILTLPEAEARHLFKVLRARPGDAVEVVGSGAALALAQVGDGRTVTVVEALDAGFEEVAVTLY